MITLKSSAAGSGGAAEKKDARYASILRAALEGSAVTSENGGQ